MDVDEALAAIVSDWPDIEPRLTHSELTALAGTDPRPAAGDETAQAMLAIVMPALGEHLAVRLAGVRFDQGPRAAPALARPAALDLIDRALAALASPTAEADAAADELAESCARSLLGSGAIADEDLEGEDVSDERFLLWLRVGGRCYYPAFQFASVRPYRQHRVVTELRSLLGADTDSEGAAAWWLTPNAWLSARPADLIGTAREAEIAYAAGQLANDSW